MKIKSIVRLLTCLLLLSGLTVPAIACCEGEPPGDPFCFTCEDGVWVLKDWADCGRAATCGDPSCYECVSCICVPVEVSSVTSDKDGACVGCGITFTATTNPPGHESDVEWFAPGGDPSTGFGATFTTHWDTTGTKTVTASLCGTSKSRQVTIAAPTNFHLVEWWDFGDGELELYYEWDSTSGDWQHLDGCLVGEEVIYPGSGPYYEPPDPPFDNWEFPNPTYGSVDATLGYLWDYHLVGGPGFSEPYCNESFTAFQQFRYWDCAGSYTPLLNAPDIIREVFESVLWRYSTTQVPAYAECFISF